MLVLVTNVTDVIYVQAELLESLEIVKRQQQESSVLSDEVSRLKAETGVLGYCQMLNSPGLFLPLQYPRWARLMTSKHRNQKPQWVLRHCLSSAIFCHHTPLWIDLSPYRHITSQIDIDMVRTAVLQLLAHPAGSSVRVEVAEVLASMLRLNDEQRVEVGQGQRWAFWWGMLHFDLERLNFSINPRKLLISHRLERLHLKRHRTYPEFLAAYLTWLSPQCLGGDPKPR